MNKQMQWGKHKQLLGGIAAVTAAIVLGSLLFSLKQCSASQPQDALSTMAPAVAATRLTATTKLLLSTAGLTTNRPTTLAPTTIPATLAPTTVPVTQVPTTVPTTAPPTTAPPTTAPKPTAPSTTAPKPTAPSATAPKPKETEPPELKHDVELNPFVADDFEFDENGYIRCTAADYWLGIDVSFYQEDIDWQKVADAGVRFAMIRIAYRGWGKAGRLRADSMGQTNLEGATAAGIQVGVYIYSQAITVAEAEEEARFVLELLNGRELDMPIVFDWEQPGASGARTKRVKNATLNACALAFCKVIQDAGYKPMVYFNQKQAYRQYDLAALEEAGYSFWLAMYTDALTFPYKVQMWQYTNKGKVPGIEGKVDIDLYFPDP